MQDEEHLRLLAILHYVLAALTCLSGVLGVTLVLTGLAFTKSSGPLPELPAGIEELFAEIRHDPELIGWVLIAAGGLSVLISVMHGSIVAYVGRCISKRRRRLFCLLFSVFNLTMVPTGTALGVYTIWVLRRESVRRLFRQKAGKAPLGRVASQ